MTSFKTNGAFEFICPGPSFYPDHDVTKGEFMQLLDHLQFKFGDGYEFAPDLSVEGGILWKKFPAKEDRSAVKTIRFPHIFKVPLIMDKRPDSWRGKHRKDIYLHHISETEARKKFTRGKPPLTELRSNFTPPWTAKEVEMFMEVFKEFGIKSEFYYGDKRDLQYAMKDYRRVEEKQAKRLAERRRMDGRERRAHDCGQSEDGIEKQQATSDRWVEYESDTDNVKVTITVPNPASKRESDPIEEYDSRSDFDSDSDSIQFFSDEEDKEQEQTE